MQTCSYMAPVLVILVQCCVAHGRHLAGSIMAQDVNILKRDSGARGLQNADEFGMRHVDYLRTVSDADTQLDNSEVAAVARRLPRHSTVTATKSQTGTGAVIEPQNLGLSTEWKFSDDSSDYDNDDSTRDAHVIEQRLAFEQSLHRSAADWTSDEEDFFPEFISDDDEDDDDTQDYVPDYVAERHKDYRYTTSASSRFKGGSLGDHLLEQQAEDLSLLHVSSFEPPPPLRTTTATSTSTATTTTGARAAAASSTATVHARARSQPTSVYTTVYASQEHQSHSVWQPEPGTLESLEREVHLTADGEVEFGDDVGRAPAVETELQEDYPM